PGRGGRMGVARAGEGGRSARQPGAVRRRYLHARCGAAGGREPLSSHSPARGVRRSCAGDGRGVVALAAPRHAQRRAGAGGRPCRAGADGGAGCQRADARGLSRLHNRGTGRRGAGAASAVACPAGPARRRRMEPVADPGRQGAGNGGRAVDRRVRAPTGDCPAALRLCRRGAIPAAPPRRGPRRRATRPPGRAGRVPAPPPG
ncbi:hypothetical protein OY671_009583, partial [Metschnikowia pulcherrima]